MEGELCVLGGRGSLCGFGVWEDWGLFRDSGRSLGGCQGNFLGEDERASWGTCKGFLGSLKGVCLLRAIYRFLYS